VSLGGGGTDLPSYYREHEGFLIAGAIDKYVFVSVMRPFQEGIYLKYSSLEKVKTMPEVEHPIIREALNMQKLNTPQIEITTLADIPAGTGLGSSGSFTTALLKALYTWRRRSITPRQLAELACHIEIDRLEEPIGKQDQYISAYGGVNAFTFHKDDSVNVHSLSMPFDALQDLEERLMLFFTGYSQEAGLLLKDQNSRTKANDASMLENLHYTKEIGYRSLHALESGEVCAFGKLLHEHWLHKKKRSAGMSNGEIDRWYVLGMNNGAVGGKLVGAGGRGFLMFLAEDGTRLRRAMREAGLVEVRFHFDFEGTKVLLT
jgi:D-glycero-alpha-D-manno-heptose-7-phosphate kinase